MAVRYNPSERGQLEALLSALGSGLSGETAMPIFQGLQQGALERQAQRRAMMQQVPDLTSWAQNSAAAGAPRRTVSGALDAYGGGPRVQGALERVVHGLYPEGGQSPLYQSPEEAAALEVQQQQALMGLEGAGMGADADDAAAIDEQIELALNPPPDPETGLPNTGPPPDLHDVRMGLMQRFRFLGYPGTELTRLYDYIGQRWTALGGTPMQAAAPAAVPAPAPPLGQTPLAGGIGARRPSYGGF